MGPSVVPDRLRTFAARIGLSGLAIAAALAVAAVQTVRMEGLKIWPLVIDGWKPRALAAEATIAAIAREQALAGEIAKAERMGKEAQYRGIAERIDDNARDKLEDYGAATERFIAAGGVRPKAAGSARGRTGASATDRDARDPQGRGRSAELDAALREPVEDDGLVIPEGFVLVEAEDVRICTVNTIKAEAGRALALELEAASNEDDPGL